MILADCQDWQMLFDNLARAKQGFLFGAFDIHFDKSWRMAGQNLIKRHTLNFKHAVTY